MIRDPLYQQILKGLAGDLDDAAFERCAQDLLRSSYPTLVPMIGGDDAGFDGAIGTPEGPFPLTCTTDRRGVLTNFRKNIETYLATRQGPKRAVVATPRQISNRQRRNLEDAARDDYGVTIVGIHDQHDFAARLYRHPEWLRGLLGLTGELPPLSAIPMNGRGGRPPLSGRDDDLAWVRQQTNDCLIAGQPGIGKTYLHQVMALQGEALFAIDADQTRLANGLRSLQPRVVVVDDAHQAEGALRSLILLREQLGLEFAVHANCWPHALGRLKAAMDVPESSVRKLLPLTRDEIVDLVKQLGIIGPDSLMNVILDQAEGKPGLAAILTDAAKRGEIERVWEGQAIAESLLHGRQLRRSANDEAVLACLSLGGDGGLTTNEVADGISLEPVQVREVATNLAAGGVIEEVKDPYNTWTSRMVVRPPALRGLLVRDVFFDGPGRLVLDPAIRAGLADPHRLSHMIHTLLSAKQRGADIQYEFLYSLLTRTDDTGPWNHFSWVDSVCAQMIIDRNPERITTCALGLLNAHPKETLNHLLTSLASVSEKNREDPTRRAIKDWLNANEPASEESIPRRGKLLEVTQRLVSEGQRIDTDAVAWIIRCVLKLNVDFTKTPPGSGHVFTFFKGVRPAQQLKKIAKFWPDAMTLVSDRSYVPTDVRRTVEDWCFPQRFLAEGNTRADDEFARGMGTQMLVDLVSCFEGSRATRSWAKRLGRQARLQIAVDVDPFFDRLFNDRDHHEDFAARMKRRAQQLSDVAGQLADVGPSAALAQLAEAEHEAESFQWDGGWNRRQVYWRLAELVDDPADWLRQAIERSFSPDYVQPFLDRLAKLDSNRHVAFVERMFDIQQYRGLAQRIVLGLDRPPTDLFENVLSNLTLTGEKWLYFHQLDLSTGTVLRLLGHDRTEVRVLAAIAAWETEPRGDVPPELRDAWRSAILDARDQDNYNLGEILKSDSSLAFEWVSRKITDSMRARNDSLWQIKDQILVCAAEFSADKRWNLLEHIDRGHYVDHEVVAALLRADSDLFRRWVRRHQPHGDGGRYTALMPLEQYDESVWPEFAQIALDEGFTIGVLRDYVIPRRSGVVMGEFSAYYESLIPKYERLAHHRDGRLRELGQHGIDRATLAKERELAEERRRAVRGR